MKKNNTKDYYKILGVDKKASKGEIRKAYTKLAKKYHPDRNRSSKEETEEAAIQFKKISEAYNCLKDEKKRRMYDMGGHEAVNG